MVRQVSQLVGKYGAWAAGPANTLTYKSAHPKYYLAGTPRINDGFIKASGLSHPLNDKRMKRLVSAAEHLMTWKREISTPLYKELASIIARLNPGQAAIIGSLGKVNFDTFAFMRDAARWTHQQMIRNASGKDAKSLIRMNDLAADAMKRIVSGDATRVDNILAFSGVFWRDG